MSRWGPALNWSPCLKSTWSDKQTWVRIEIRIVPAFVYEGYELLMQLGEKGSYFLLLRNTGPKLFKGMPLGVFGGPKKDRELVMDFFMPWLRVYALQESYPSVVS